MYIYYTIDTEFWPQDPHNPDWAGAGDDFLRDVFGVTRDGEYGIRYQMDALEAEGLKGVFFIEALHALRFGDVYLREMVGTIQKRGHEVGLHIHPEWLGWLDHSPLGGPNRQLLMDFSIADQHWIIDRSLRLLRECGVSSVVSFRAGNYGADRNTLRALADEGVLFDSSYIPGSPCGIAMEEPCTSPRHMEGLIEVPITFIRDYPGHYRPMQIRAASFSEMQAALDDAQRRGFPSFVFVSHGFELIRQQGSKAQVDQIVCRRFDDLVKYLGRNKDRFEVTTFAETVPNCLLRLTDDVRPVKGSAWRTSGRILEQLMRRTVM